MSEHESIHYVYVIASIESDLPVSPCKIGITKWVAGRLSSLQTGNPKKLEVISALPIPSRQVVEIVEKAMHEIFDEFRLNGEWFDINPIDATIGVCTVVHELFEGAGATEAQVTAALNNLGITRQIAAAFQFINHCKERGLLLQSRLMQ